MRLNEAVCRMDQHAKLRATLSAVRSASHGIIQETSGLWTEVSRKHTRWNEVNQNDSKCLKDALNFSRNRLVNPRFHTARRLHAPLVVQGVLEILRALVASPIGFRSVRSERSFLGRGSGTEWEWISVTIVDSLLRGVPFAPVRRPHDLRPEAASIHAATCRRVVAASIQASSHICTRPPSRGLAYSDSQTQARVLVPYPISRPYSSSPIRNPPRSQLCKAMTMSGERCIAVVYSGGCRRD
ncbi:hypothetical protein CALCODRAFT_308792 [Calocera cornea HHB12733]|uniref:Uncharacterized protein n=1 Tax=Calocera cornea HHB12733 TaxID=1353952 RepID=A0A165FGU7_9BASI|nr:hypothetical protein CALCODRAFT_308792 [Calocera cornea HHB12733]